MNPFLLRRRRARLAACATLATVTAFAMAACAESVPADQPSAGLDLSSAPWADPSGPHRIQDLEALPSLTFAADVDYPEALTRLYVAARTKSASVEGAQVSDPLPPEVVYVAPDQPDEGLRLSLTAPWGWVADGAIRPPSIALPGSLSPDEVNERIATANATGAALPEGATVDVPILEDCQIGHGDPDARPPC
jgi:hypothetical protein